MGGQLRTDFRIELYMHVCKFDLFIENYVDVIAFRGRGGAQRASLSSGGGGEVHRRTVGVDGPPLEGQDRRGLLRQLLETVKNVLGTHPL